MIRFATIDDIDRCHVIGEQFRDFSPYSDVPYCPDTVRDLLSGMIKEQMLIIAEDGNKLIGLIGGSYGPIFFNREYKIAYELFWYVDPEHRGSVGMKLLFAFERRAKEIGCQKLMMMTLRKNDVGALYTRLGFDETETGFVKRL